MNQGPSTPLLSPVTEKGMDGVRLAGPGESCRRMRPGAEALHSPCADSPSSAQPGRQGLQSGYGDGRLPLPRVRLPRELRLPAQGLGAKSCLVCIRQTDRHKSTSLLVKVRGGERGALADFRTCCSPQVPGAAHDPPTPCLTPSLRLPDRVTPRDILTEPTIHF